MHLWDFFGCFFVFCMSSLWKNIGVVIFHLANGFRHSGVSWVGGHGFKDGKQWRCYDRLHSGVRLICV
jgi:hypothetical protein